MNCGGCGHSVLAHGRRGHGACRFFSLTDYGDRELKALAERIKDRDTHVQAVVIHTAMSLPGMTETCGCKRFRKTTRTPDTKEGSNG